MPTPRIADWITESDDPARRLGGVALDAIAAPRYRTALADWYLDTQDAEAWTSPDAEPVVTFEEAQAAARSAADDPEARLVGFARAAAIGADLPVPWQP